MPTRAEIKAFIDESPHPVTRREIVRAFNLKGLDRAELRHLLSDPIEEGALAPEQGRRVGTPGRLPSVGVIEIVSIDADAEAVAKPVSSAASAPDARILLRHRGRGPSYAPGDRVLARISHVSGDTYRGSAMRRLERAVTRAIGLIEASGRAFRFRPTDGRRTSEAEISPADIGTAEPGALVAVELIGRERMGVRRAKVLEVIAGPDTPKAVSLICLHEHDIPHHFPPEAVALAEAAKPLTPGPKREDMRDIPLITIDGADARDFDDAVWAEADSGDNEGGWKLLVAIADVSHYVRPGDALDQEAEKRGNSVYFPDRVAPMLPEALSNTLCSLRPGEDRGCLAVEMRIGADGRKRSHHFRRGVMRSFARVTYEEIQDVIDQAEAAGARAADETPLTARARPLFAAYRALLKARDVRGALNIETPDMQVHLDEEDRVTAIEPRPRLDSHRLIEEFMVLANVAAAESLEKHKTACIYRIHDAPDPEKLDDLRQNVEGLGLSFPPGQVVQAALFNGILRQSRGTEYEALVNQLVLRSQSQAIYSPNNIGHFGLGLLRYAHFTSPIRRYADLLVHRALIAAHDLGSGGARADHPDDLVSVAEHISMTERRAAAAERDAVDRFAAAFLKSRVGEDFEAVIASVTRFGLFVSIAGGRADALLAMSRLPDDYYDHDPRRHKLVGRRTGRVFGLGETVSVTLHDADPLTGRLMVDYVGSDHPPAPRKAGSHRPEGHKPKKHGGKKSGSKGGKHHRKGPRR